MTLVTGELFSVSLKRYVPQKSKKPIMLLSAQLETRNNERHKFSLGRLSKDQFVNLIFSDQVQIRNKTDKDSSK